MAEYVVVDKEQLESDLTTVADAIREKGGTTETFAFPQGMADAVNALPDAESDGSSNLLWDMQTSISYSFQGVDFGGGVELVIPLGKNAVNKTSDNASAFQTAFYNAKGISKVVIENYLTFTQLQSLSNMFACASEDNELVEIDIASVLDSAKFYHFGTAFKNRRSLQSIIGIFDFSNVTSSSGMSQLFQLCYELKNLTVKENSILYSFSISYSPLLSDESIQSIIDGLADLTGVETQTLTFHADVKAKLTEEQITTITSKNWTLA